MPNTMSVTKPVRFAFPLITGFALLLLAGYWQQVASAVALAPMKNDSMLNATIPPGTIPPGTTTPDGKAKITVIHAAPLDADPENTAVDICTEAGTVVSGLADLKYLYNTSIFVDPGQYDWKVADADTNCANVRLDLAPFTLLAQQEVVLILTGDNINQPIDALLLVTKAGVHKLYLPIIANLAGA